MFLQTPCLEPCKFDGLCFFGFVDTVIFLLYLSPWFLLYCTFSVVGGVCGGCVCNVMMVYILHMREGIN